ncbi:MAG: peptidylprolyl isomerase [Gemmatimonadales bacterium]|nr:peptidylprolyl isomerase [Gemmatimonadales bacterium]MDZ4388773.1 peptidylprolyl isomerase [Gemmatimonadales bacterium]
MRLRRLIATLPIAAALLVGCSDVMSIDAAREAMVVEVDGVTLTGATLEGWLLEAPAQPSELTATVLLSAFIDGALLGNTMRQSESLEDSATVAEAVMPDAVRGTILNFFANRAARRPPPSDAEADSVARLGAARVFQHILLQIDWENADSAALRARGLRLQALGNRLQAGEDFAAVAAQASEDTISRANGGFLPAIVQGDLPASRFATVAWQLQPGEISGIVTSPAGIHILRRPPLSEARSQFKAWLAPRLARRADSVWVDSLSAARQLLVASSSGPRLQQLAREPHAITSDAPFATWEGGELTPADLRRWVTLLPPADRVGLSIAADSVTTLFLREVAQRELVYRQIVTDGGLTTSAWDALAPQFRQAIAVVREEARPILTNGDPSAATAAWVTSVTTGGQRYRPLPSGLAGVLRSRQKVTVNHAAITSIIAAALPVWLERRAADSTSAAPVDSAAGDSTTP